MNKDQTYDRERDGTYLKWKTWDGQLFGAVRSVDRAYFRAEMRKLPNALPRGSKVLEIGFGNGKFLGFARDSGWEVIGTELNLELVRIAEGVGFKAIHCADLRHLESETFDLVVAFDVLEHLPKGLIADMFSDVRRILKPGGCFVSRFPNGDSPLGLVYQNGDMTHETSLGSLKIRYLALSAGFDVLSLSAESQPIICGSFSHSLHRLFTRPIKAAIDLVVNLVFFPRGGIVFSSPNLTAVLMRSKEPAANPPHAELSTAN